MPLILWMGLMGAFSHAAHVDSLQCLDCHTQAQSSEFTTDLLLPDPKSCTECHDSVEGYVSPESARVWIAVFSHQRHQDAECQDCHGEPANPKLPKMRTCLECHDTDEVRTNCWMCHDRADTRMTTYHPKRWSRIHAFRAGPQCFQCHWKKKDKTEGNPTPGCLPCHNKPH